MPGTLQALGACACTHTHTHEHAVAKAMGTLAFLVHFPIHSSVPRTRDVGGVSYYSHFRGEGSEAQPGPPVC